MTPPDPKRVLATLGYRVDGKGNVSEGLNQLALVSLEDTEDGGVLRIHGATHAFFYGRDPALEQMNLAFPIKVTRQYVYFKNTEEDYRITLDEFRASLGSALQLYNQIQKIQVGG